MRFRKLRIAWSVAWGLATVLMTVLWVRSYWSCYSMNRLNSATVHTDVSAYTGNILYTRMDLKSHRAPGVTYTPHGWEFQSGPGTKQPPGFVWVSSPMIFAIQAPIWFLALWSTVLALLPWMCRFSLRTLLIATTLVAVTLGLIVWTARN